MAARHTPTSEAMEPTWAAFKPESVDWDRVDTNYFRVGYPKPTIYREHEAIHLLAHLLDVALAELGRPPSPPIVPAKSTPQGNA